LEKRISVPGDYGWDYLAVDSAARRLYVSHDREVVVIDVDSYAIVGTIPNTRGVHGIAVAPEFGRGFITNGTPGSVTIFDLKTLATIDEVKVGENPNCVLYDPKTKRIFTADRGSQRVSAIDPRSGKVIGTIENMGGKVEYAIADGEGHVFMNMQDRNTVVRLDAAGLKVMETWPLAPCEQPTSIAMDRAKKRLFIGCRSGVMSIVNTSNGKLVATLPIGKGVDATTFDPQTNLVFNSNGDGTLTVTRQESPEKYTVVENVKTQQSARTMALDPKTHKIFLSAAEYMPAPDAPKDGKRQRAAMKPGSFSILVFAP
jgi:DNA-binding beta-propeller fold protein YncE